MQTPCATSSVVKDGPEEVCVCNEVGVGNVSGWSASSQRSVIY